MAGSAPLPHPFDRGLVQVYTGDGKGKTTAALGIALRASGHNLKVYIVYFMKGGYPYGEQQVLANLPGVDFSIFGGKCFVSPGDATEQDREEARRALARAREVVLSGQYQVVILDEINVAAAWDLIDIQDVLDLVRSKPANVELILTGRYADPRLIALADLVTEMVKVKHPFDKGVESRVGIEC